jgi:hypothetical protein
MKWNNLRLFYYRNRAKDAIPEAYGLTVKHAMDVPVMLFMTLRLYFLFQYLHVPTMLVYTSLSHEAKGNNVDILSPAFLSMYARCYSFITFPQLACRLLPEFEGTTLKTMQQH